MDEHKRELAEIIWEGMDQDRILGPCPQCREAGRVNEQGETNRLKIIRAKKSGKRFVGCEGYPDCDQTYGIPQRGDLIRLEETCSICGQTPRLKVIDRPPAVEPVPERGVPLDGGDAQGSAPSARPHGRRRKPRPRRPATARSARGGGGARKDAGREGPAKERRQRNLEGRRTRERHAHAGARRRRRAPELHD